MSGAKRGRYPVEVRERMVFDDQHEFPSQWKAIESISKKLRGKESAVGPPPAGVERCAIHEFAMIDHRPGF